MAKLCDPKCYELAEYFFPEASKAKLMELACEIQQTVEDFEPRDISPEPAAFAEEE